MNYTKIKNVFNKYKIETLIAFLAILLSSLMAWRVYSLGLEKALTDQNAHLNFSRLAFDSITPGLSQIGYWPPLFHILMAPFTLSDFLYQTGLAGFVVLLPFLIMGSILLYRTCLLVTENKKLSFIASLLFLLNPYVLYYTVTPMMEVLFISNLIAVAYFMALWLKTNKLWHLLACGIFISLASISRFEGLILIPIAGLIVFIQFLKISKNYRKIEASIILFFILAVVGLLLVMGYGLIYGGNPFAFAGGGWWLRSPVEGVMLAKNDILMSLQYIYYASSYMIGISLILISLFCFSLLFFISKKRWQFTALLLILIGPLLFVTFGLFRGTIPIEVLELPPNYKFLNERYTLTWIGFVIMSPILLIHSIVQISKEKKISANVIRFTENSAVTILILLSIYHLNQVVFSENFVTLRLNTGTPSEEQIEVARILNQEYDYGKILAVRVDNDPVFVEAHLPLKVYIHEGNYIFYEQVLGEPWFFARWVIMYNSSDTTDKWAKLTEPVSVKWENSENFNKYYDLVFVNKKKKLYRINEETLKNLSEEQGYDFSKMPSVNSEIIKWNPETIYEEIGVSNSLSNEIYNEEIQEVSFTKATIKNDLVTLYNSQMRDDYQKGFFTDKDNVGNSETQSYLLIQSYLANDKETFEKVWSWTKNNIQRREDYLFSWQFRFNLENEKVEIIGNSPATDADEDIAYILLKAGEKWSIPEYIKEAKLIINDLWEIETTEFEKQRLVIAGDWADSKENIVINPSYFSPLAYRLFAEFDTMHNWNSLVEHNYDFLMKATQFNSDNGLGVFLPPNWIALDKETGNLSRFGDNQNSLDYSYDAFRVFWRVAIDYRISENNTAKQYLDSVEEFKNEWEKNNQIYSLYELDKNNLYRRTTATMAGPLSVFISTDSAIAEEVVKKYYLESDKAVFPENSSFYDKHWYWMGLALWSELDF